MNRSNYQYKKMSDVEYKLFSSFIRKQCGIDFDESRRIRLEHRVWRRVRTTKMGDFMRYYRFLKNKNNDFELLELYNLLTVNETRFFRNLPHFEILTKKLLPNIVQLNHKVITIWSAACATGQEPYTIAMTIDDFFQRMNLKYTSTWIDNISTSNKDVFFIRIIATDLSNMALKIANNGIYSNDMMANIPPIFIQKYFHKEKNGYRIIDKIKAMINFKHINLIYDSYPMNTDIVFIRNVLMYFPEDIRQSVLKKVIYSLLEGGSLFLGDAEVLGDTDDIVAERLYGNVVYRKKKIAMKKII